jgi:hypothetical protein
MSRGLLDDSEWEKISQKLPNPDNIGDKILHFSPDFISLSFAHESSVPVALIYFRDSFHTLEEAIYALSECFAYQVWYLEKKEPPNKMTAAFFGRYYLDDAALRLYSAAEHLANGIIMMLEITDKDLKPYKQKKTSQRSVVGNFMREQKPCHPITKIVANLEKSKEWRATMRYRNRWVHEQPPTVKDLGIVYRRKMRWEILPEGKGYIMHGGGDQPEYSVEDLVGFIKPAMFKFTDTLTSVVDFYIDLLKSASKHEL